MGDTTLGQRITLPGDPTTAMHAATKQYVDAAASAMPTGTVMAYAGATAPAGWLMCNNLPVSRTTYAALFALIGTTYGSGNGSTTFNLPDLRGRVIAGVDSMGGAASAGRIGGMTDGLGRTGGTARVELSVNEMPSHTHTQESTTAYDISTATWGANIVSGSAYKIATKTAPQTGSAGGGAGHENMQHTMLLNWIIKT